jgi:hypothetical protein
VRRSLVVGALTLIVLSAAAPARAQSSQEMEAFVVLTGRADVPEGERVGDLVVFHGSATVDGTVEGSLTAFDAPVTISGRVEGDVVVFNGRVQLRSGAEVTGDVVSRSDPAVASGATIGGDTSGSRPTSTGKGSVGSAAWDGGSPSRCRRLWSGLC